MDLKPSNYFLNRYISMELSDLTANNIPELLNPAESYKWVNAFVLKSAFAIKFDEHDRVFIMNFLRRAESAVEHYSIGRKSLDEYLNDHQKISRYLAAVTHFEIVLSHAYQAYLLGKEAAKVKALFKPGDGSPLDRLRLLYNVTKHYDEQIGKERIEEINTLPIWLTNTDFKSTRASLSYIELFGMINELNFISNELTR